MILRKLAAATIASTVLASGAWGQDVGSDQTDLSLNIAKRGHVVADESATFLDGDSDGTYTTTVNWCAERNSTDVTLEIVVSPLSGPSGDLTVSGTPSTDDWNLMGSCAASTGADSVELSVTPGTALAGDYSGTVIFTIQGV